MSIRHYYGFAALALFSFFPGRASAITATFGPKQAAEFLDITFDVSDGHWVHAPGSMFREWVYDGPGVLKVDRDGWRIEVTAPDTGFGYLYISAPDAIGQKLSPPYGLAYEYWLSELGDNGAPTPLWFLGFGDWASPFTWSLDPQPPKPSIAGGTVSSRSITWNVPDAGMTWMLLLPVLLICGAFQRRTRSRLVAEN